MNHQWRSAQWTSAERAEPQRTLFSMVEPYIHALFITPIKFIAYIIVGLTCICLAITLLCCAIAFLSTILDAFASLIPLKIIAICGIVFICCFIAFVLVRKGA